jgi:hypothetical protein
MSDPDKRAARTQVRANLLRGLPLFLLMGLAAAGLLYEAKHLPGRGVWPLAEFRSFGISEWGPLAAFFSFALAALLSDVGLLLSLPRFRDVFRWPPHTVPPQMLFPRIARSRPWVRAAMVFLAVGVVLLPFGFVR